MGSQNLARLDFPAEAHEPEAPGVPGGPGAETSPDGRLSVRRLTLTDFRCYHYQRLEVDESPVVLTGPNHKSYLPTLAATQSKYPADVCAALERAGFTILISAPSRGPAWPLGEQKRDMILMGRKVVRGLETIHMMPPWVEELLDLLQTGGQAWTDAEKAKIADLNWRIVAEKH